MNEEFYKMLYGKILMIISLCSIWALLEIIIYGEVQPRIVDDIMMALFAFAYFKKPIGE